MSYKNMETIEEELLDEFSESAAIPSDSSDDDGISEDSSAVFLDLESADPSRTNLLPKADDEVIDQSSDKKMFNSQNVPSEFADSDVDETENDEIEDKLLEIDERPSPSVSEIEEVESEQTTKLEQEATSDSGSSRPSNKKYDLSAGSQSGSTKNKSYDLSGSADKKYDLGGQSSAAEKKYDLSDPSAGLVPIPEKKHDLNSYLNTSFASKVSIRSVADDETRTTQQRSGSTALILHKWLKDKDWNSARVYLSSPQRNQKRLQESVHYKNDDGETALHIACRRRAPYDIVKAITKISGAESVMAVDSFGGSLPLHHACHFNAPFDVIQLLVSIGGRDSVNKRDAIGNLPIHWALSKNLPPEAVKLFIDIGGWKTVNMTNRLGWNSLHAATYFRSKYSVIKLLVDTGGKEIANTINKKNKTALDILYEKNPYDKDSIQLVQDKMGEDDEMMTWLPKKTSLSTLDWVKRQSETVQERAFQSPCLQMILNDLFLDNRFLAILMIDFFAQVMLVITLSFGMNESDFLGKNNLTFSVLNLLIYSTSWLSARVLMSMVAIPVRSWIAESSNWLGGAQSILAIWTIVILAGNGVDRSYEATVLVLTTGIVWFRMVFVLGDLFYNMAIFAFALQRVMVNLLAFMVSSTLVIFGFAHMLYTAAQWESRRCAASELDGSSCIAPSLEDSYYTAFTEFLSPGNIFSDEPYLRNNQYHLVLTFAFAVLIELVLLNVLIAEIVRSLDSAKERGKCTFWHKRFNFIMELGNIYKQSTCSRKLTEDKSSALENTSSKQKSAKTMPTTRFTFSTANFEIFPGDFYNFCKWWTQDGDAPCLPNRVRYFLAWASFEEIYLPCNTFERVLSGKGRDTNCYLCRLTLYFIFPFTIVAHLLCFIGGLLSCGYLWPKWMKRILFSGSVDKKSDSLGEQMDIMRNEVRSISNELKTEKLAVQNLEGDVKDIHIDLKKVVQTLSTSHSIYTEDEVSDIFSANSEEA